LVPVPENQGHFHAVSIKESPQLRCKMRFEHMPCEVTMQFSNLSIDDLKLINRRTMERLRAEAEQGGPILLADKIDASGSATVPPGATGSVSGRGASAMFANSEVAKFSRSEIRNAFIVASKKLSEKT
jgi:hypothetical protein